MAGLQEPGSWLWNADALTALAEPRDWGKGWRSCTQRSLWDHCSPAIPASPELRGAPWTAFSADGQVEARGGEGFTPDPSSWNITESPALGQGQIL